MAADDGQYNVEGLFPIYLIVSSYSLHMLFDVWLHKDTFLSRWESATMIQGFEFLKSVAGKQACY